MRAFWHLGGRQPMRNNIHATGIVLGEAGVIFRGPSGAGKSLLALALLTLWDDRGLKAALVADDRLDIAPDETGLLMRAPPGIAGLMELRGRGIIERPWCQTARIDLVVDLVDAFDRMPEETEQSAQIAGVVLPRCPVPRNGLIELGHRVLLVREALRHLPHPLLRQKTT
ncbi:MAG: HPr kinase/phosphorylase [Devosia sp.]